jgi:hypothetical protein
VNVTCSTKYRFFNFSLRSPKSSQKPNITGLLPALLSARATQYNRLLNFSLRQPGSSEYSLTALGASLSEPVTTLDRWVENHLQDIAMAQREFDRHDG